MPDVKLENWKREITYYAHSVEFAESVDDIVRIVQDRQRYPSPVRGKGSHHSTTDCVVTTGGTVIDLTRMNKIVRIDPQAKTVTVQPGVLHIDLARELEKHGLQLYVNCEIGNLTYGSAACSATKDASYCTATEGWEYGQVNSYCVGIKAVGSDGTLIEVTEKDGELMQAMRSSYGMLGIIYEATFKVKDIKPLAVEHVVYHVDEFADRLEELIAGKRSMMLFLFPHLDRVMVEYRWDGPPPITSHAWQWKLRNYIWATLGPFIAKCITTFVPFQTLRGWLNDLVNRATLFVTPRLIKATSTSPADQIIRYPPVGGFASYTFSIWAFPRAQYPQTIRDYFQFCKDYEKTNRFRCDLLDVGYHVAEDTSSLFSYTRQGPALTLDPVCSGGNTGWQAFLVAYNEFCIQHNGRPLFNQTPHITPLQAKAAFGPEIETFQKYRREYDRDDRFYTPYFRQLFEGASLKAPARGGPPSTP
jgi:L-gulonolactone oxidase